jgi:hypothetical protein
MRKGGCFCGAVRYTVKGEPINVRVCHCRDCQKLTGSAFFVRACFPEDAVTITGVAGEIPSSVDLRRNFCSKCGSQLFSWRTSRPDVICITLGTFDDLDGLRPTEQVWSCDKQPWLDLPKP